MRLVFAPFAFSLVMSAGCNLPASATGSDGSSGSSFGGSSETSSGGSELSSCPQPDPTLDPIPESQAASTQAAHLCIGLGACGCGDVASEVPSCRHRKIMAFEPAQLAAQELGLVYDGHCLAQQLAEIELQGCASEPHAAVRIFGSGSCSIYHGALEAGQTCTSVSHGMSDCAQGLACWDGICIDACAAASIGDRCDPFNFSCAPGHFCFSGRCEPYPELGAECHPGHCGPGRWCEVPSHSSGDGDVGWTESMCRTLLPMAAPCELDEACESGFCSTQGCAVGPVTGQACVDDKCLGGRPCESGTCGAPQAALCDLGDGA